MNERKRFWQFDKASRKPAPAHGIKLKKAGTTWWGQRWIEALEAVLGGDARRLARGRTYARAGRAHDLSVSAGAVTARVTGTRPTPYAIRIELAQLVDAALLRPDGPTLALTVFEGRRLRREGRRVRQRLRARRALIDRHRVGRVSLDGRTAEELGGQQHDGREMNGEGEHGSTSKRIGRPR